MEVRRIVSEPTAAAMAYGLHKKSNVEFVIAVDMGKPHHDTLKSVVLTWL